MTKPRSASASRAMGIRDGVGRRWGSWRKTKSRRGQIMKHARATLLMLGLIYPMAMPAAADTWREKVAAFAAKNLQEDLFYSHSRRDYVLAKNLAAADHVTLDEYVIFAAAYLHDMGAVSAFAEPKKEHADVGAEKIDIVLAKTDFPKAKLEAVRTAIRTHNP